jgi:type I restriction enzyme R subunit
LYAILKGDDLEESSEEANPNESSIQWTKKQPGPVAYNEKVPIEFFDFIVIDDAAHIKLNQSRAH